MGKTNSERTAIGNWLVGMAEYFNHFAHKDERADRAYKEVEDVAKATMMHKFIRVRP
uniref:hypothetical protein n=1 Tax=Alloprevotella sp. TaxID=1872471 RepID=UPI0040296C62